MKNKKAVEINFLIMLILGIFVFLVLATLISRNLGKGDSDVSKFQSESGDYDSDGVTNFFDKCKCKAAETDDGCPSGYSDEQKKNSDCLDCTGEMEPKGCPA